MTASRIEWSRSPWNRVPWDQLTLGALALDGVVTAILEVLYLPAYLGSVMFPVSILVAALLNVVAVVLAMRVTTRTMLVLTPIFGWVLGYALCMLQMPGGSILLTQSEHERALLLMVFGLGPAVLTAAFRRRTR